MSVMLPATAAQQSHIQTQPTSPHLLQQCPPPPPLQQQQQQQNVAQQQTPQHSPPTQQQPTPQTPSSQGQQSTHSNKSQQVYSNGTNGLNGKKDEREYSLVVEQQPVRARMCGFGDKDRRPITPPPCIRLVIRDAKTMKEVDFNEVDGTFFVLNVDLWSADAATEVNLVRHSGVTPTASISTATTTSFPPPPERPQPQLVGIVNPHGPMTMHHQQAYTAPPLHQHHHHHHHQHQHHQHHPPPPPPPQQIPGGPPPPPPPPSQHPHMPPQQQQHLQHAHHHPHSHPHPHPHPNPYMPNTQYSQSYYPAGPPVSTSHQQQQYAAYATTVPVTHGSQQHAAYVSSQGLAMPTPQPASGMFTRNLIGSLTVNAFRLADTEGKIGFWFVLQDLSVRTEGTFRLKMNFINVGNGNGNGLNTGKAPVLATVFSDVFQVYSAKKFPGVIESTPLSRAFASQGIKIPIRKDGPKQLSNQAEYDADD